MRQILFSFLFLSTASFCTAQIVYVTPTHLYNTYTEVTNSARADALGKNTITLNGIRSAFDNPAAISPGKEKMQVAVNFFSGNPMHIRSQNYFAGVSYKVADRITVGLSAHRWVDPDGTWTTIIRNVSTKTSKKSHQTYSLHAAAKLTDYLHLGLSGNYVTAKEIDGIQTMEDFILSTGLVYDRPVKWFNQSKKISNEQLRLAFGFTNLLFKGQTIQRKDETVWQYRDIPIIMRLGAAYSVTMPLNTSIGNKSAKIKALPKTLDLSARIQYNDFIKHKTHSTEEARANTLIGIGVEATAMQLLSARIGYFRETRTTRDEPGEIYATTGLRKGLTFGLGLQVPLKNWTKQKWPFDVRFDLLANRHPKWLSERITRPILTDKKLFLGLGLELNF